MTSTITTDLNSCAGNDAPVELLCYAACHRDHPEFRYLRRYWRVDGPQGAIGPSVLAKLKPAGHDALRHDLLLPEHAPGDYMDLAHLLERYDAASPTRGRNGYTQFTIDLPPDRALHRGWEKVRSWAGSYFVRDRRLAVLMVLHAPYLAGSRNLAHIHLIVPVRPLEANGFGAPERTIATDEGAEEAYQAWCAFEPWDASL